MNRKNATSFTIPNRGDAPRATIGLDSPAYIIAEAGVNHNGSRERALQLIDVAVQAGADAIKFQTFNADRLVTLSTEKAAYQKNNSGSDETQYEMLKKLELDYDDFVVLFEYCEEVGIEFVSTPFDETSVDMLEKIGVSAYKIPSGEVTNLPYIEYIARKQKPMFISTGMSNIAEVEALVNVVEETSSREFVLLHCVSNYPTEPEMVNLRAMESMKSAFQCLVGYSDHTLGVDVSIAAVAMGARVIEKHFTLDRTLPGPDHLASLEPGELKRMIDGIRIVESSMGDGRKRPTPDELDTRRAARKSIVALSTIESGATITREMVGFRRPGTGFPPPQIDLVVGRTAAVSIFPGDVIVREMLV